MGSRTKLVGARGFEPPASASRTLRSTRLSHAPMSLVCCFLVPKVGVEPTRGCPQRFLRPPRLPFRHFGPFTAAAVCQQSRIVLVGARGFEPPTTRPPA